MNNYTILQIQSSDDENSFDVPSKTVLTNLVALAPILTLPITAVFRAIKASSAISEKMP
jgi:hypothetical protein